MTNYDLILTTRTAGHYGRVSTLLGLKKNVPKNKNHIFTSTEYKYLIYLVDELHKIEEAFKKLVADRDVKLSFLLRENLYDAYGDVVKTFDRIKSQINDLDATQLASAELEDIGETINQIIEYYNYFHETCENIKV